LFCARNWHIRVQRDVAITRRGGAGGRRGKVVVGFPLKQAVAVHPPEDRFTRNARRQLVFLKISNSVALFSISGNARAAGLSLWSMAVGPITGTSSPETTLTLLLGGVLTVVGEHHEL